jgi:hypothetical protein
MNSREGPSLSCKFSTCKGCVLANAEDGMTCSGREEQSLKRQPRQVTLLTLAELRRRGKMYFNRFEISKQT